jgi:hypothetical protein
MKTLLYFLASVGILALGSCTKYEKKVAYTDSSLTLTSEQFKNFEERMSKIPLTVHYFDEKNNRHVDFDVRKRTVTFNKSWSFANPQPNTIYGSGGGLVVYLSSSSTNWGYGSPTHTITAGSTTLNVQTLCLAVDASAYAAMFAGQTGQLPFTGISVVMGLDADFSLLANASSTNFGNYFKGLAYYLVYDSPASGSYSVIDWTNLNTSFPQQQGFSMVFSFDIQNNFGAFYFSQDGQLNVSGGDISFNGNYWGIETVFNNINPNLTYGTYPGSGTMGCQ